MKRPSPYPLISWVTVLKLTPALHLTSLRHVRPVAAPAVAVDDDLKFGGIQQATPGRVAFFYGAGVGRFRSSGLIGFERFSMSSRLSARLRGNNLVPSKEVIGLYWI